MNQKQKNNNNKICIQCIYLVYLFILSFLCTCLGHFLLFIVRIVFQFSVFERIALLVLFFNRFYLLCSFMSLFTSG